MTSLSKYIYNAVQDYYLGSKGFYFNSDKLTTDHAEFEIANNWSGAETYTITINLNSKKNDLLFDSTNTQFIHSFIQFHTKEKLVVAPSPSHTPALTPCERTLRLTPPSHAYETRSWSTSASHASDVRCGNTPSSNCCPANSSDLASFDGDIRPDPNETPSLHA